MTQIAERTILFADLRGSTSLFEQLGNAEATSVVTHTIAALAAVIAPGQGKLVKTLGDGLMAVFNEPPAALRAADQMHEVLDRLVSRGHERGASAGLRGLKLQIGLACGEVVEMGGDCFGDAVNVAARLIDHAGDNETLLTAEVAAPLPAAVLARARALDRVQLRGRAEPVQVHAMSHGRRSDQAATQFGDMGPASEPEGIRLGWGEQQRIFAGPHLPIVLGRSPQASWCIDDSRVSRSHARIDWHGGGFQLTDLSYNGTYVRFGRDGEIVSLRRGSCTLHGRGSIGLGAAPGDGGPTLEFEVLIFMDTLPSPPAVPR
jgi:class 3 adenylate cyclase